MIRVTCFGAAGSVTGSNYLLETSDGKKIIIDCGLFQGSKEMELRNWEDWGYDPKTIKNIILTHAHIDHSGRIPKIVKDGFRGKIISSPPTAELCEVMLLDSAHVQEMEAEWKTRKNRRRAKKETHPLYTTHDAIESLKFLAPTELDQIVELEPGIKLRLRNAGHILGSCIAELWIQDQSKETKVVFSGDLGKHDQLIVKHPFEIGNADFLFIESTYGDRRHRNFEDSKAEFLEAISYAVSNREKVIIPAFALERTQEVLYLLGEFSRTGKIPNIPIFLDSPLAIKATEIFRKNKKYYDEATQAMVHQGFDPFDMPNLTLTPTTKESMEINELNGSAIIISANGMCSAGRIKHHLKHNLWRPGASVIIAGFQAQGSTGRQIVDGAKTVSIFGEKVAVRAKVFTIGGLSAHADQDDLLAWVGHFSKKSTPTIFVTHGEPASSEALATKIHETFGMRAYVPKWREVLALDGVGVARELAPEPVYADLRGETLALVAELEAEIVRFKQQLATKAPKLSEEDLEKLRDIREELQAVISG
ncbi:MAG: MBL fold metallo-hydrolase [Deltaproteobacteria bacterium]|nr:MBL fold metallo-hydrolase [Deltaproteobacteria bacterium]